MKLRPLGEQTPSPPAPPWQRCGGGCSRWWWQHRDEPCAAAAAAQSRFCPDAMRCGGESGPPADKTEPEERPLIKKTEQKAEEVELVCC